MVLCLAASSCGPRPTAVRLDLRVSDGRSMVADKLSLTIYGPRKALLDDQELQRASLPGDLLVLLPDDTGEIRLVVRADDVAAVTAAQVMAHSETRIKLALSEDTINDRDGDGVPDEIDNCWRKANSDQADSDGNGDGDACDSTASCVADFSGPVSCTVSRTQGGVELRAQCYDSGSGCSSCRCLLNSKQIQTCAARTSSCGFPVCCSFP